MDKPNKVVGEKIVPQKPFLNIAVGLKDIAKKRGSTSKHTNQTSDVFMKGKNQNIPDNEYKSIRGGVLLAQASTTKKKALSDNQKDKSQQLITKLDDGYFPERLRAMSALGKSKDERSFKVLISALNHRDSDVRRLAAYFLGKRGDKRALPVLLEKLKLGDSDALVNYAVAKALGEIGDVSALPALIEECKKANELYVWSTFLPALAKIGYKRAVPILKKALNNKNQAIRNAAIYAVGESGDKSAISALISELENGDYSARYAAVGALGKLRDKRAVGALSKALTKNSRELCEEIVYALEKISGVEAAIVLANVIKNSNGKDLHWTAAEALGRFKDKRAIVPVLIAALNNKNEQVRSAAVVVLASSKDKRALRPLISVLLKNKDSKRNIGYRAVFGLGELEDKRAVSVLEAMLTHSDKHMCECAAVALGKIGGRRAVQALFDVLKKYPFEMNEASFNLRNTFISALVRINTKHEIISDLKGALNSKYERLRSAAAEVLGIVGDKRVVPELIALLKDGNSLVRLATAEALGEIGDKQAIPALTAASDDDDWNVSKAAKAALEKIQK